MEQIKKIIINGKEYVIKGEKGDAYDDRDYYITESPNLFNIDDTLNLIGYYSGSDGNGKPKVVNSTGYRHTHPIKVYGGTQYKYTISPSVGVTTLAELDRYGNPIRYVSGIEKEADGTGVFTADFTGYVSFSYAVEDKPMFCELDRYPSEYTDFGRVLRGTRLEGLEKQFKELGFKFSPDDTTFIKTVQNENLFNLNDEFVDGYFFKLGAGDLVAHSTAKSYYVRIYSSGLYSVPVTTGLYGQNAITKICLFDKDKNYITSATGVEGESGKISSTNTHAVFMVTEEHIKSGAVYIGFTMYQSETEQYLMVVKGERYPTEFIPYARYLEIDGLRVAHSSFLSGKVLSLNGDSICAGAGFAGGYGKIIAENNGMICDNVSESGGTITAGQYSASGSVRHWICRTIENMNANADYAIVEGGVNDASLGVPMGEITADFTSTLDDTTFCGAFESMLKQLTLRFAGKKIGYIAVHKMANKFRSDNADDGTSYYWMAKKCCEKWGVPFLDLNIACPPFSFLGGDLAVLRETYTYNGDGWHPNEEGYKKYYVPKIEAWLKTL